jgi:hypothetical protein
MKEPPSGSEVMRVLGSLGVVAVIGYVILAAKLGVAFAIPVGVIGSLAAAVVLRGPLGQYLLGRGAAHDPAAEQVTGQLLGEVDDLRNRVQELEERVDFSERLLASHSRPPEQ